MNRLKSIILLLTIFTSCNYSNPMEEKKNEQRTVSRADQKPKVTGIGLFSSFRIPLRKRESGILRI